MAVDPQGHAHELRRMVPVKAAELYERMVDIDPAMLPSVSEAKQQQEFRRDLGAWAREEAARSAEQEKHRVADPSRAETAPEAAQQREASAAPSTPETSNTHTTEPQREPAPARDAPRVIYLGPPAELDRAAGIAGGLADGVEKALGAALDAAADFIAPPPPPTKEQVEQMKKAAEQDRQQEPARQERAEYEARVKEILEQIRRDDQRARQAREHGVDRDDDYDRGRERERSR
jgi:hypothetical protein